MRTKERFRRGKAVQPRHAKVMRLSAGRFKKKDELREMAKGLEEKGKYEEAADKYLESGMERKARTCLKKAAFGYETKKRYAAAANAYFRLGMKNEAVRCLGNIHSRPTISDALRDETS